MSGLYPPGPMLGSGIDDYDTEGHTDCGECGAYVATTLHFRGLRFWFECPACGADGEGSL